MMATAPQPSRNILPASEGFGTLLRRWRYLRGFTQGQLSRMIDCDPAALSRWERGERIPNRESALALVDALQLTGPHRAMFLGSLCMTEHPLTESQASAIAGWRDGFTRR